MSRSPVALAIGGMLTMAAANGIDRFVYTPILPDMMAGLTLTTSQAGLIASANFLGYLLGALFAARPELPWSRRSWLLGSLLVSAFCTGVMALAASMPAFLVLRLIGGFAGAVAIIMAIALVVERLAGGGRAYLAPIHFAGVGVGIAVSAILVSILQATGYGWRAPWVGASIVSLCCTAGVAALVAQPNVNTQAAAEIFHRPISRKFWLLIAANGLGAFGYVITGTFIVALVRGSSQLQPLEAWIWVVFGLASAPSVALWMWLAGRIGVFKTFSVVCLVEAVGVLASVTWLEAPGTILGALFVGGSFMGLTALGMVGARRLTEGDVRRPVALMTASFGVGQIIGPGFAGFVHDVLGSFLVPSLCAVAALVTASVLAIRAEPRG